MATITAQDLMQLSKRKEMANKQTDRHENRQQNSTMNTGDANNNEFPGYPHYDKKEDIMDGRSDAERVNVDIENIPSFHNATTPHRLNTPADEERSSSTPTNSDGMDTDLGIEMGTDADVTDEERKLLEDDMYYPTRDEDNLRHARLDDTDFDGEKLNEESFGAGQAETGDDLDIDAKDETTTDAMGQGDEENQYWSLSSERDNNDVTEGNP